MALSFRSLKHISNDFLSVYPVAFARSSAIMMRLAESLGSILTLESRLREACTPESVFVDSWNLVEGWKWYDEEKGLALKLSDVVVFESRAGRLKWGSNRRC